jgi:methenyltetrahydrofolate cyclohydrolase
MLKDKTVSDFCSELASASAVPGGGGAAALAASLGVGLDIMVGCLTVGKKKYAASEPELKELAEKARTLLERCIALIDADAAAFEPLSRAYALPKDAPDRDEITEKCLDDAAAVPLELVRLCGTAIELTGRFAELGSALAVSDAGCAAALCRSSLESAALNVFVNTRLMKNRDRADELNGEVSRCLEKYIPLAENIYNSVKGKLKPDEL